MCSAGDTRRCSWTEGAEDIRAALEYPEGKKWEDWELELLEPFRPVDGAELFRGLFRLAVSSQSHAPAYSAAWLLYKLKPACPISCREAIGAFLFDWDVSIEEPVFYLAEQFGVPTMLSTIEEIGPTVADREQQTNLVTVRYWVGCFQEMLDYRVRNEAVNHALQRPTQRKETHQRKNSSI